uniref:Uncharacterized protein n=1 Tax=viral metagenome TaxID=1070528 RepID=A0A6C0J682_9ZZZZ
MIYFILGFFSGAYAAQNYNLPNVEKLIKNCIQNLESYNKSDKSKK